MRKTLLMVLMVIVWTSMLPCDRASAGPFLNTDTPFLEQRNYYYLMVDACIQRDMAVPVPVCLGYIYVAMRSYAYGYESHEEYLARLDKVDLPSQRIRTREGQQVKALVTLLKRGEITFEAADGYLIALYQQWQLRPDSWW